MDTKKTIRALKALSNLNRFEIFMEIYKSNKGKTYKKEECFVFDIMEKLSIGAPTISHHLKELSNADLIFTERKGRHLIARINKQTLKELSSVLNLK